MAYRFNLLTTAALTWLFIDFATYTIGMEFSFKSSHQSRPEYSVGVSEDKSINR
jgi:hypothetical protein